MQITLWLFGAEVFSIKLGPADERQDGPGDCVTQPIGFTARLEVPQDVEVPDRDY